MNKFIAVTAILVMTGISSYVLAQTTETKPADAPAAAPVATVAAPATATPPAVKPVAAAPVAVDTTAITSGMQGNTIISRDGSVIVLPRRGGCDRRETGSVEVTFQYTEDDVSGLAKEIDTKVATVKSEAVKAGATAEAADLNYTVNSGRNFGGYNPDGDNNAKYHINGSMHFNVTPADKAVVMLQALSAGKDHVSLNYRMTGGFCPPNAVP
jgi:hypothetical protein